MKSCAIETSHANTPVAADADLEVILIGYGNTLRSDDGAGPAVIELLRGKFVGSPHFLCLTYHQLVPELVMDLSGAKRLIFIDASAKVAPGKIRVQRLKTPDWQPGRSFHTCSPEGILGLMREFYGQVPPAWTVALGVADLSFGEGLSPRLSPIAERLANHLAYCICRWTSPAHVYGMHEDSVNGQLGPHHNPAVRRYRAMER